MLEWIRRPTWSTHFNFLTTLTEIIFPFISMDINLHKIIFTEHILFRIIPTSNIVVIMSLIILSLSLCLYTIIIVTICIFPQNNPIRLSLSLCLHTIIIPNLYIVPQNNPNILSLNLCLHTIIIAILYTLP
ncbi:hypothetical protein V8G54_003522 [Vigna mungo]|uniref:Uncharacterized protein n=1 Tax=Vigna mungo TaxID=3915 RepID=A0AAQ3SD37_VIGMU